MRVAVLILGLLLGIVMLGQTVLIYGLSGVAQNESMAGSGAVGILVALMWLIAIALVFGIPLISALIFVLAGGLALLNAASSTYSDMGVWGIVSLVLALMSFFAWRSKRRKDIQDKLERAERKQMNERMELLTRQVASQQQTQAQPGSPNVP